MILMDAMKLPNPQRPLLIGYLAKPGTPAGGTRPVEDFYPGVHPTDLVLVASTADCPHTRTVLVEVTLLLVLFRLR